MKKIIVILGSLSLIFTGCGLGSTSDAQNEKDALKIIDEMSEKAEDGYLIDFYDASEEVEYVMYKKDDILYYDGSMENMRINIKCNIDGETSVVIKQDGDRTVLEGLEAATFCSDDSELVKSADDLIYSSLGDELKNILDTAVIKEDNDYYIFTDNALGKFLGSDEVEDAKIKIAKDGSEVSVEYQEVDLSEASHFIIKVGDIEIPE